MEEKDWQACTRPPDAVVGPVSSPTQDRRGGQGRRQEACLAGLIARQDNTTNRPVRAVEFGGRRAGLSYVAASPCEGLDTACSAEVSGGAALPKPPPLSAKSPGGRGLRGLKPEEQAMSSICRRYRGMAAGPANSCGSAAEAVRLSSHVKVPQRSPTNGPGAQGRSEEAPGQPGPRPQKRAIIPQSCP